MITLEPIGYVRSARRDLLDDAWDAAPASIEPTPGFEPLAPAGLAAVSPAEIVYHFDRVAPATIERGARHPRGEGRQPTRSHELRKP